MGCGYTGRVGKKSIAYQLVEEWEHQVMARDRKGRKEEVVEVELMVELELELALVGREEEQSPWMAHWQSIEHQRSLD